MVRVVDRDVRTLVSVPEAIEAVRHALLERRAGRFEAPPRTAVNGGSLLLMPAVHRPSGTAVTKVVTVGSAARPANGHPTIQGVVIWFDPHGAPGVVMDAAAFTALRTAAVTAAATELMAPEGANRLTVFGAGALAGPHIEAIDAVRPLESLTLISRSQAPARQLASNIAELVPRLSVRLEDDPRRAVADADMVCCVTTATTPLFETEWLAPSVHVSAAGSHTAAARELPQTLLTRATSVVVDALDGALLEAGEIIDGLGSGALQVDELTELAEVIARPRRREGLTVFKSVGMAAEDWALANAIAAKLGLAGAEPASNTCARPASVAP